MEESKIMPAYELAQKKRSLIRCIEDVTSNSPDWFMLLDNFRRAGKEDFLGEFEAVKQSFITELSKEIDIIDEQIEAL
jgi:hypothetical protein